MKFLYVAPRFHPNQVPIVDGLIDKGHEVRYWVRYAGATEKNSGIRVDALPYSMFSKWLYYSTQKHSINSAEDKMIFWFLPKMSTTIRLLKDYYPDVIIMRERNLLSLVVNCAAKLLGIHSCILYNQSPIFQEKQRNFGSDLIKKMWRGLFPRTRITVCRYKTFPKEGVTYLKDTSAHFLPFIPRYCALTERSYSNDGKVRVLDIGKYRIYKNHFVIVDAVEKLINKGITNIKVAIYGQYTNEEETAYYKSVCQYINEKNLALYITAQGCVAYDNVTELLCENDVFVLTSKSELANISILDAMSFGMATIAVDENGTTDYIKDGLTGLVYHSNDSQCLADKLEQLILHPDYLRIIGENAMHDMRVNCSFDSYYRELTQIIESL